MPLIVWFALGALALTILLFATGNWAGGFTVFVIAGLGCGLYEKLDSWGLIPERSPAPKPTPPTRAVAARPQEPVLPIPVAPTSSVPVTGLMRVDVTRTERTVDVFITLSEKAKYIFEKNDLRNIPVEQHFDGLKTHMEEFAADYDFHTRQGVDDPLADWQPHTSQGFLQKELSKQTNELANVEWEARRQAQRKYALEDETQRYKQEHTVTLAHYLANPHRQKVSNPLEANIYIDKLEKTYLPFIKSLFDVSSPIRHDQTKTYEF
jgi:hypothetical protein